MYSPVHSVTGKTHDHTQPDADEPMLKMMINMINIHAKYQHVTIMMLAFSSEPCRVVSVAVGPEC